MSWRINILVSFSCSVLVEEFFTFLSVSVFESIPFRSKKANSHLVSNCSGTEADPEALPMSVRARLHLPEAAPGGDPRPGAGHQASGPAAQAEAGTATGRLPLPGNTVQKGA